MAITLLRLLAAHIIGDFLLQPDRLCRRKELRDAQGITAHLIHAGIQAALAYLFVADWTCWLLPILCFIGHFMIDILKMWYLGKDLKGFLIDQTLHVACIIAIWWILFGIGKEIFSFDFLKSNQLWIILIAYLIVFQPTSILLNLFLNKWTPTNSDEKGLPLGGKWIGYLERLLIVTFVITNNIECIGFLLAAKSIFRFGELNKPNEVRTTEYVLIGSLSSFTAAIIIGYVVLWLIH